MNKLQQLSTRPLTANGVTRASSDKPNVFGYDVSEK